MLQTLDNFVPPVRSRHPIPAAKQAQIDRAIRWLATTARNNSSRASPMPSRHRHRGYQLQHSERPRNPLQIRPDQARNLTQPHALPGPRVQFVGELRQDLYVRRAKARKCEEMLAMIAAIQSAQDGDGDGDGEGEGEGWQMLGAACQRALENVERLEERLGWCEENFETGMLTSPKLRIWGGGEVEIDFEGGERGRSSRRAKRLS